MGLQRLCRVLQEMLRLEAPCFVILEPLSVYEVEATGHGQKDGWWVKSASHGISIIWIHDLRARDIFFKKKKIYIYIMYIYIHVRVATRTNTLLIRLAQCQTALSTVRKGNPISKEGSAPQILRKHVNYPLGINHGLLENPTLTVDDTQFSYQKMRFNREVPSLPCLSRV